MAEVAGSNAPPPAVRRVLVITVHGIRTFGQWQERLEALVLERLDARAAEQPDAEPLHYTFKHKRYGYFSVFKFINPISRWLEVRRFADELDDYVLSDEFDKIYLVGHSFGTHVIAHALRRLRGKIKRPVERVILSGSVLRPRFRWHELIPKAAKSVVNECGDRDWILVMNAVMPLGSGVAGRLGFMGLTGAELRNRFFNFGHSGYFVPRTTEESPTADWFMRRYWVPLLVDDVPAAAIDERVPSAMSGFRSWAIDNLGGFKIVVPLLLTISVLATLLYYASITRTRFNLETVATSGRAVAAVEDHHADQALDLLADRERQIASTQASMLSRLESIVSPDAMASYRPPEYERAGLTVTYAQRRKVSFTLASEIYNDTLLRFVGGTKLLIGVYGGARQLRDLETGALLSEAPFAWSGPAVAAVEPDAAPQAGSIVRANPLQTVLETRFSVSADTEGLHLWDLADLQVRTTWPLAVLPVPIVLARPCGSDGAALALDINGAAWLLSEAGGARRLVLPAEGPPLVSLIGDRACRSFAGLGEDGSLLAWPDPEGTPISLTRPGWVGTLISFSAGEAPLLLVNEYSGGSADTSSSRLFRIAEGQATPLPWMLGYEPGDAVFSPSGRHVVSVSEKEPLINGRQECRITGLTADLTWSRPHRFICPWLARSPADLVDLVRFDRAEMKALIPTPPTRDEPTNTIGDIRVAMLDLSNEGASWLSPNHFSPVAALDISSDGVYALTSAGDFEEGTGSNRSVTLWSRYSPQAIDVENKAGLGAKVLRISPDGRKMVIAWSSWASADVTVDIVDIGSGGRPWNGGEGDLSRLSQRTDCDISWAATAEGPGPSDNIGWLFPLDELPGGARGELRLGCRIDGDWVLETERAGKPVLLELRANMAGEGTGLFARDAVSGAESLIAGRAGSALQDNVAAVLLEPSSRKLLVVARDGGLWEVVLDPTPSLRQLAPRDPSLMDGFEVVDSWADLESSRLFGLLRNSETGAEKLVAFAADGSAGESWSFTRRLSHAGFSSFLDASGRPWIVDAEATVPDGGTDGARAEEDVLVEGFPFVIHDLAAGNSIPLACDDEWGKTAFSAIESLPTVRLSGDGSTLIASRLGPTVGAAVADTAVAVWDFRTMECLGVFEQGDEVLDIAVNGDGKLLVTSSFTDTKIWHVPTHTVVKTLYGRASLAEGMDRFVIVSDVAADVGWETPVPADASSWRAALTGGAH